MNNSKLGLAEQLALIADKAVELRKAGVTEFTLDGLSVRLAPYMEPEQPQAQAQQAEHDDVDALDDPSTYGLPPGAPVPGFAALRERREKGSRS